MHSVSPLHTAAVFRSLSSYDTPLSMTPKLTDGLNIADAAAAAADISQRLTIVLVTEKEEQEVGRRRRRATTSGRSSRSSRSRSRRAGPRPPLTVS